MAYREVVNASLITSGTLPAARGGTGLSTLGTVGQVIAVKAGGTELEFKTISGTVASVTGTTNRITVGGTASDPVIDIASTYVGQTSITTLGTVATGTWNATVISVLKGGTGVTTAQAAMNAFAGAVISGQYLRGNGTNVVMSAIQAGDVPTLNQNTTGTAANVTGTVAIANGGTGNTTAQAALNALASSTVTSGHYLRGNGTNILMSAIQVADIPTLNQNTTGSSAYAVGIPQVSPTFPYTVVASDSGKHILATGEVTVATSTAFATGNAVTVINNTGSAISLTQGSGTTLRLAGGSTGSRTIAAYGMCTAICIASNSYIVSGQGVS
jgi:hypothetical protein